MATQTWKPRRVTNEEDRNAGSSDYIQLADGQNFVGVALFDGDPTKNDPAYYEYFEHWASAGGGKQKSVPCPGDGCPYCEDGDRPRVRAKTVWLVSKNEKGDELDPPELRIFNFNKYIIDQITEMRGEGEKIKGATFRVSRLDDRGNYMFMRKQAKLTVAEVKEALSDKRAPDLEQMVTGQLRKAMEALGLAAVMQEPDDPEEKEEDEEKPAATKKGTSAKGSGKGSAAAEDPDDPEDDKPWETEAEDLTVIVAKVGTKADPNTLEVTSEGLDGKVVLWGTSDIDVTELDKGDVLVVTYAEDGDEDKVLSEMTLADLDEDAEPSAAAGGELPDSIEDAEFEIVSIDKKNETMNVKSEELELEFTLFFLGTGPASKVDFDDYEEGAIITVSAEKDAVNDMVATVVPELAGTKTKKGSGAKRK